MRHPRGVSYKRVHNFQTLVVPFSTYAVIGYVYLLSVIVLYNLNVYTFKALGKYGYDVVNNKAN